MKLFDPDSLCAKCGNAVASVKYVDEVINRKCARCGYVWRELPLDQCEPQSLRYGGDPVLEEWGRALRTLLESVEDDLVTNGVIAVTEKRRDR